MDFGHSIRLRQVLRWTGMALACSAAAIASSRGEEPRPDHPPPLPPEQAVKRFQVAEGLQVNLVAAEPDVAQPVSISFDDRGRMWVLQYRQYPIPNGLTAVEMDEWLRTKYDRRPEPPPEGPKGQDRISIYEDSDGDGRVDVVRDFINDLNLASGMALGHGGVFVVQPPYLLFYADRNGDDVPDGPPDVLLTGFGMEDAHAFANSLTWGPDGWLYGTQGSTSTADIRGIGFQQGVWRYHPRTDRFELFAEGGGNSWGVEFDRHGNVFAAGNTVEPLVHHVQGAYYVKGFGKHGPLHNPHAYGYFLPVQHHGYVGDSLTGGAVIYQGGFFPEQFADALIAPNTRHSAMRWSTIERRGSTFATRAGGDFLTTDDIWFRPVDSTVGPDGALYVADWYDYNISHSSPQNRSQWYQPSRLDGRIWRVAPAAARPRAAGSFDLQQLSSGQLLQLLSHDNDWYVRQARRILAERQDPQVIEPLEQVLHSGDARASLQALWGLHVTAGLSHPQAVAGLQSSHEYVRAWTVRLLGDEPSVPDALQPLLEQLASSDESVVVRSQLACTAKRLPASSAMPIIANLLQHEQDADDVHVPLLIWWAVEDKAIRDAEVVLRLFAQSEVRSKRVAREVLLSRLARRFTAEDSDQAYGYVARLLESVHQDEEETARVLGGMLEALAGRRLPHVPPALQQPLEQRLMQRPEDLRVIELALRLGLTTAEPTAISAISNGALEPAARVALLKAIGETRSTAAAPALLKLLDPQQPEEVINAALGALGYFADPSLGQAVLARYGKLPPGCQARVVELLCGRPDWARQLLQAVDSEALTPAVLTLDQVRRLRGLEDPALAELIVKHWGRVQSATPLEMQGRITAVSQLMYRGSGDPQRGQQHFQKICANCHKLHGQGNAVGPDLTGADRKNRDVLIRNIVDPSAMIREQYIAHVAQTTDGRVLTGLLAESTADNVTLLDAKNQRTTLARAEIEELAESPVSLMPEKLLEELSEQQIRDLIAYVMSEEQAGTQSVMER